MEAAGIHVITEGSVVGRPKKSNVWTPAVDSLCGHANSSANRTRKAR